MSRLFRFSRQAFDLRTLHHRRAGALPFLYSFSTESSTASEPTPTPHIAPLVGIERTKNVGRAAFALQRLTTGEVLHGARPIVAHPYLSMIHCVCYYCLRRLPKRDATAEAPRTVSFCSERCQQDAKRFYDVEKQIDWSNFHEYCRQKGLKYPLIIKRFACQIIAGNIPIDIFYLLQGENLSDRASLIKEEFDLLRSTLEDADIKVEEKKNKDDDDDDDDEDEGKDPIIDGEAEDEGLLSFLTEEWYLDILGKIRINAFRVELPAQSHEDLHSSAAATVEGEGAVGNAMYMLPSFYNHSCEPNANIIWSENAFGKMVALRDIEEAEEVRICYLDASMGYEARQKLLFEGYGFRCDCPRCVAKE